MTRTEKWFVESVTSTIEEGVIAIDAYLAWVEWWSSTLWWGSRPRDAKPLKPPLLV